MMHRVSTNFTLLLKLFLPTFWAVFFGLFTLFVLFYTQNEILFFQNIWVKLSVLSFYLVFFLFFYFTLWQLKRVEMSEQEYHISNYFSTYRLVYDDIQSVSELFFFKWILVRITLKGKASFGRKIYFLASKDLYENVMILYPELGKKWDELKVK